MALLLRLKGNLARDGSIGSDFFWRIIMKNIHLALMPLMLLVSNMASANVWAPTNADSNFFNLETLMGLPTAAQFGIFEDNVDVATAAPIISFNGGTKLDFTQNGNNWDLTSGSGTGTLSESSNFQIGYLSGAGWIGEAGNNEINSLGGTSYQLFFIDPTLAINNVKSLFAVDIISSEAGAPVPLPAAAWFLGTGLIGLMAVSRRKKAV